MSDDIKQTIMDFSRIYEVLTEQEKESLNNKYLKELEDNYSTEEIIAACSEAVDAETVTNWLENRENLAVIYVLVKNNEIWE